ncbi:unnamed protein product [Phytophthora lilii]|uniref:Unnamed protein product n=1 Tax=Phytophthora lilii TaxID=2077276 RepID=A0A9W6TF55_9STRA|nr:unnamed protein product [Phytophthora lilii]
MPEASRHQHLHSVLLELQERDNRRRQELANYPRVLPERERSAPQHPIFDEFVAEGGGDAIMRLTNFTPREINTLWASVRSHVARSWNVGRGRRSKFTGKYVMFMLLVVLKNGGTWEMLSNIFHVKTPTFIKTITSFVRVVAPRLCDDWVSEKAEE